MSSTPEEGPADRHYHYVPDEILVVEDDVRLIQDQIDELGLRQLGVFRPRFGDVDGTAVVRYELRAQGGGGPEDLDVLGTVTRLRRPVLDRTVSDPDDEDAPDGVPRELVPRVSPHIVIGLSYHGRAHGAFGRRRARSLDRPHHRHFLPLPGYGVTIGVLDTGMWTGRLDWYGGRVDLGPTDEEPLGDDEGELTLTNGHGTFITGVIHRTAPGAKVKVRRISESDMIADEDLAKAIIAMAEDDVDIISLSWSGPTHDGTGMFHTQEVIDLLRRTKPGLVVVAAAGNAGVSNPEYPAAFKGVVAVGAIDRNGKKTHFTNYGPWLDVCAPGESVHSTFVDWRSRKKGPSDDKRSFEGYAVWSGTSFSTPAVAAAIAVRRSPGGWRQFLWFLRPRNARQAADRIINDPDARRVPSLGTVVNPEPYPH